MLKRQTTGSIVCPSCGSLVGVNDPECYNCKRRNPGLWGYAPFVRRLGNDFGFVPTILIGSVGLYVLSLLLSGPEAFAAVRGPFSFLSPSIESLFLLGASGALPVYGFGRWWTLLSAGWLHGNLLHVFFNMLWVRQLAPATAELFGPGRLVIIYTVAGVCGFALSSTAGAYFPMPILGGAGITVGASAPIFGLLGALVQYGRRTGSHVIRSQAVYYAVMLFVFGLVMRGVDNFAHAGGFAGGFLAARWLDPLKPERGDHLVIALGCLAVSLLAVVASFLTGVPLMRP